MGRTISASVIKTVQRGSAILDISNNPVDVTITAVDTNKSFLVFSYEREGTALETNRLMISGRLTSTTNIRFDDNGTGQSAIDATIYWEVVEYV